jgi:hypothetical protein
MLFIPVIVFPSEYIKDVINSCCQVMCRQYIKAYKLHTYFNMAAGLTQLSRRPVSPSSELSSYNFCSIFFLLLFLLHKLTSRILARTSAILTEILRTLLSHSNEFLQYLKIGYDQFFPNISSIIIRYHTTTVGLRSECHYIM